MMDAAASNEHVRTLLDAVRRVIGPRPTVRVAITCDECGRRHVLERTVDQAGEISIVCHACELPLVALLDPALLQRRDPSGAGHGASRT
ncbi:MAG: hypothetical protein JWM18_5153 [Chloroflexi bacterium]|jgi:hypothetical protein|nr:hypothetical protein [Chloroflexota bacterium]